MKDTNVTPLATRDSSTGGIGDECLVDDGTLFIVDTMEVFVDRGEDEESVFLGLTESVSISREISTEEIFGGIGRKKLTVLTRDEGMNIEVDTSVYYTEILPIQGAIELGEEEVTVIDIESQPDGTIETKEKVVVGDISEFRAGQFAKNVRLQMRTIAYNRRNEVVADIYYIVPNAQPSSDFNEEYSLDTNTTQTIMFTPLVCGDDDLYMYRVVVPREKEEEKEQD